MSPHREGCVAIKSCPVAIQAGGLIPNSGQLEKASFWEWQAALLPITAILPRLPCSSCCRVRSANRRGWK